MGSESGVFECNICFDLAEDPVITMCGHLHCWQCIYKWLDSHDSHECPVCKTLIQQHNLVPLYGGRGGGNAARLHQNPQIPRRPRNFEGGMLSPVFSVRFHEFSYGGSLLRFNYGSIGEGEQGNDKTMVKILVFLLLFVLFDFVAM